MSKPTLVIMAAGMGSRFGGLKQLSAVDKQGYFIMDYSIFDAIRAGFGQVICIIKEEMQAEFESKIGNRIKKYIPLSFAYQSLDNLPQGFSVSPQRTKPLGTAHAIYCAKDIIKGPFVVINADDFYGHKAFLAISKFLTETKDPTAHAMVGYILKNTLTENGSVSRGICQEDAQGFLTSITERTAIVKTPSGVAYTEDAIHYIDLPEDSVVSMNLWGFQEQILETLEQQFCDFLKYTLPANPLKAEWYLPNIPAKMIKDKTGTVKVLKTDAKWYGVTYPSDLPNVVKAIEQLKKDKFYPTSLWEAE